MDEKRAKDLTIRVLNGATYRQAGEAFKVSSQQARQITLKTLRDITAQADLYKLKKARRFRVWLISLIEAG